MRNKTAACVLVNLILFLPTSPTYGQTAAEINTLLMKSKLVDTGRMVNTTIGADKTTISTYCNPQATNKDCKVTALLMMKELKQHYKTIHRIRVLFFIPADSQRYREVEIREGDTLLVDEGKPLPEVLSQIDVTFHKVATPPNVVPAKSPRSVAAPAQNRPISVASTPSGFVNYRSPEGDVAILYPSDWVLNRSGTDGSLFKAWNATASITLFRHLLPGVSLEQFVNTHEIGLKAAYQGLFQA